MPALAMRTSGFFRRAEIGRMRPQFGGQTGAVSNAGFGALGNEASTAGSVVEAVLSVMPSKFSESSTTLLKASIVVSAPEAWNNVLSVMAYVNPTRGWKLFRSLEQAGISPFAWKQLEFGPWIGPP